MKLIIFDIDGTLTDSKAIDDACFVETFKEVFDMDIGELNWSKFKNVTDTSITTEILSEKFSGEELDEAFEKLKYYFLKRLSNASIENPLSFQEVPGSKAFFDLIKSRYHVGIGTGSWSNSGLIKLNAIGIKADDYPFGNCDNFVSREGMVQDAIRQAKTHYEKEEFSEIVYFGDGVWDYKTCKNLSIRFIGIDSHNDNKLRDIGAKTVFTNYLDAGVVIEEIEKGLLL